MYGVVVVYEISMKLWLKNPVKKLDKHTYKQTNKQTNIQTYKHTDEVI